MVWCGGVFRSKYFWVAIQQLYCFLGRGGGQENTSSTTFASQPNEDNEDEKEMKAKLKNDSNGTNLRLTGKFSVFG